MIFKLLHDLLNVINIYNFLYMLISNKKIDFMDKNSSKIKSYMHNILLNYLIKKSQEMIDIDNLT